MGLDEVEREVGAADEDDVPVPPPPPKRLLSPSFTFFPNDSASLPLWSASIPISADSTAGSAWDFRAPAPRPREDRGLKSRRIVRRWVGTSGDDDRREREMRREEEEVLVRASIVTEKGDRRMKGGGDEHEGREGRREGR
jgi:hypothetical protein